MHVLTWIALTLPFFGIAIVLMAHTGATPWNRRAIAAVQLLPFALSILLIASLAFAQRPICSVLGGRWIADTDSCQNEWGGNENNDVSNGGFPFRLETRD